MIEKNKRIQAGLPLMAASALLFPFAASTDAALVTIDGPSHIYFNGSTTVRWDDNIFLQSQNEEDDVIFIFSPGLELNLGERANANINLYYRHDFHVYADNSSLDGNYANLFLETYWAQPRLDLRFDASYQQLATITPDLRIIGIPDQLIERDYTRANLRGEYELTERTSIASGVNYTDIDFDTRGFSDRETVAIPVNLYYSLTPMVDLSVGYRFRHTDNSPRTALALNQPSTPVPNYKDHYFNIGARGELLPKLIGEARAGYQQREISGQSNQTGSSFGLDFSHFTTPKVTLLAGVYRDYDIGGSGASITATGGSLGARYAFNHLISGQAGVNYVERSWDRNPAPGEAGREDETFDVNVGVTYSPNVYVDLSAGYIFRTNNSNIGPLEFDNNIVSVSAALRY